MSNKNKLNQFYYSPVKDLFEIR